MPPRSTTSARSRPAGNTAAAAGPEAPRASRWRRSRRPHWRRAGFDREERQECCKKGASRHDPDYPPLAGTFASSASQASALPSDGARQSPRGESEPPEPTFGALGATLRLNWLRKKRLRNTPSHLRIAGRRYLPFHACQARNATLAGE